MIKFRSLWKHSLTWQALLILLVGFLLSQCVTYGMFLLSRSELEHNLNAKHILDRVVEITHLIENSEPQNRLIVLNSLNQLGFRIGWGAQPLVEKNNKDDYPILLSILKEKLPQQECRIKYRAQKIKKEELSPKSFSLESNKIENISNLLDDGTGMSLTRPTSYAISIALTDRSWLNFAITESKQESFFREKLFLPLLAGNFIIVLVSLIAVKNAIRPLNILSQAAERIGRDISSPPLVISGTSEVRNAALAFNKMQERLKRFLDDRSQMIAAISHDLRTPITRLRLRAEFVEDEEKKIKILSDLDEMETMISSTISFAKEQLLVEPRQTIDLVPILQELCDQFSIGYQGPKVQIMNLGPVSMKRVFSNLMENAQKYGQGGCLYLETNNTNLSIIIEDNGKGIPEDELEKVFNAFYRLDRSRNRETGGTGLGLTVARSIVHAHGGTLTLSNYRMSKDRKGLRATITLPR